MEGSESLYRVVETQSPSIFKISINRFLDILQMCNCTSKIALKISLFISLTMLNKKFGFKIFLYTIYFTNFRSRLRSSDWIL